MYTPPAQRPVRAESDYDVAVFLHDMDDSGSDLYRLADLSTAFINEPGTFVHAMPYPAGSYRERAPLMLGIRTDGIDL